MTVRAIYISSENAPEQLSFTEELYGTAGVYTREKKSELLKLETTVDTLRERYGDHCVHSATYLRNNKLGSQRIGFRDHSEIY